jgi:hypothetical protein
MHKLTEDRDKGEGRSSKIRNYLFRSLCVNLLTEGWGKGRFCGKSVIVYLKIESDLAFSKANSSKHNSAKNLQKIVTLGFYLKIIL